MRWAVLVGLTVCTTSIAGAAGLDPGQEFLVAYDADNEISIIAELDVPEGMLPQSVRWLNSDSASAFPSIRLLRGNKNGPGPQPELLAEWIGIAGDDAGWSEISVRDGLIQNGENLFVEFRFPAGSPHSEGGRGSGLGIGYWRDGRGASCYIGSSRTGWLRGHRSIGLAVECGDLAAVVNGAEKSLAFDEPYHSVVVYPTEIGTIGPNPANPTTTVSFSMANEGKAVLQVYDVRGRLVRTLIEGPLDAGPHAIEWNGRDRGGALVSSGAYLVRLAANGIESVKHVTILK